MNSSWEKKPKQLTWNTKTSFIASWHFVDAFKFFVLLAQTGVSWGKKKRACQFYLHASYCLSCKATSFSEKSCCQVKQNVLLWTDTVCGMGGYPITVSDSKEQLWQQCEAVALSEVSLLMEGCSAPGGCDGSLAVLLWGWCPITGRIKVTYVLCVRAANRIVLKLEVQ